MNFEGMMFSSFRKLLSCPAVEKLYWCALCLIMLLSSVNTASSNPKEVVIIGAGIAGATVARQLANDPQGRYRVTLLEGREDRIGGRLWTDRSAKGALGADGDLGGALVDCTDLHTPLCKLLKRFELSLVEAGPLNIRSPAGSEMDGDEELATTIQHHLIEKIHTSINTKHSVEDFSAQEALDFAGTGKASLDDALWEVVRDGIIEPAFGTSLRNLSAGLFEVERISAGHFIMEGMDEIVNRLISGWDSESLLDVELGKVVRQVMIDQRNRKVRIRTTDRKSITADVVVVAVPLGVLKSGDLFFDPPLSAQRQNAIKQMGFGQLNKVILRFDSPFWPDEPGMFVSTAEILKTKKPLISSWMNGYRLTETPALIGYVTGDAAIRMEAMDVIELKEEALKSLGYIFGDNVMRKQKVISMQRSSWSGDPLAGGSASFYAVGTTREMRKELFRPVCPFLYFAGEHATLEKPGCAEGAFLSGLRVADQIINGCHDDDTVKKTQKHREEL